MPPKKHKKGNQNVQGKPAKRIRRPSRWIIEATSAVSETSDVHVPCAPASTSGGETINVNLDHLPSASQVIPQSSSSDRQDPSRQPRPQGQLPTDQSLQHSVGTSATGSKKRKHYLNWPDYFMATAFLSAQRSKDPETQVGACIVNEENKIVGIGYNGMPVGCHDDEMPWERDSDNILETKQLYVCHAELNAVLNKNSASIKNCTIYVTLFPCNECAKVLIQSGIKEVVYYSNEKKDKDKYKASEKMLDMAGVIHRQHIPKQKQILIDFTAIDAMTGTNVKEVLKADQTSF